MKKGYIILSIALICFLAACSVSKQARTYRTNMDGKWKLQTVVTEGIMGQVKIRLFDEADFSCFVGSDWNFNSRNSLATYTIVTDGKACGSVARDIRWSIHEDGAGPLSLQFKKLDNNLKPIDGGNGYRLDIIQADKSTMKLQSNILFENRQVTIIYNFVRI